MHRFRTSICDTMLQFNDILITQVDKGKEHKGIRKLKIFEFKNTRTDIKKMLWSLRKKESNMSDNSYIPNKTKIIPVIDFTEEQSFSVMQKTPVVENTSTDDCKEVIQMTNNTYKLVQINCLGTNFVHYFS